jgi:hypothetical protein
MTAVVNVRQETGEAALVVDWQLPQDASVLLDLVELERAAPAEAQGGSFDPPRRDLGPVCRPELGT